ncbi:GntR family transcriptional regulator [Gordonia sp. CPCC 206044]|uniref:GntR family transcriptional regulator n=1 Tax=Gordonia sp. CPCC 206044 TaxID=3140793 RepID=UPI003AF377C3
MSTSRKVKMPSNFDTHIERRAAHERARNHGARIASVPGAHGALYSSLRTGLLSMGDQLDETHLVPMLTFSRNAVRDALRLLADEGIVTRRPRNGTIVVATSVDVPLDNGLGWGEKSVPHREVVVTEQRWVQATPVTRRFLETDNGVVHVTEAVDMFDGRPSMIHTRFTINGAARPLLASPATHLDFRQSFLRTYGCGLDTIDCWVDATEADERTAGVLRTEPGTPLIVKSRVLRAMDGRPREYSISHYIAAEVSFSAGTDGGAGDGPGEASPTRVPSRPTSYSNSPDSSISDRRRASADLHAQLRAAIREGLYRVGDRLSEEEIAEAYAVSRSTVRLALNQLAGEGIIGRSRHRATVVVGSIVNCTLNGGVFYPPDSVDQYCDASLASQSIPTPPFVRELLRTDDPSTRIDEYLISRDGRPTSVYIRYTSTDVARRPLTCGGGEDFSSLFRRTYGQPVGRIVHNLHAVRASGQLARRLAVEQGSVLLLSERLIHDGQGAPRELSHTYHVASGVSLASHFEFDAGPNTDSSIVCGV